MVDIVGIGLSPEDITEKRIKIINGAEVLSWWQAASRLFQRPSCREDCLYRGYKKGHIGDKKQDG